MRSIELDFLRQQPRVPMFSWALLILGGISLAWGAWQYSSLETEIRQETELAARLSREARLERMRQPARQVQAGAGSSQALLDKPWGELLFTLERSRIDKVALLALEADAAKSQATITAEAANPVQMLNYIDLLQKQPGLSDVALTSHLVDGENPQQPVQFSVRFSWGQP